LLTVSTTPVEHSTCVFLDAVMLIIGVTYVLTS